MLSRIIFSSSAVASEKLHGKNKSHEKITTNQTNQSSICFPFSVCAHFSYIAGIKNGHTNEIMKKN